jgi:hypothetical protein
MVAWLENAEDASSDLEVWKVEKGQYGFADLDTWLKNDGKGLRLDGLKEKMEKRSHKAKNKGKGKEKEQSPQKAQK